MSRVVVHSINMLQKPVVCLRLGATIPRTTVALSRRTISLRLDIRRKIANFVVNQFVPADVIRFGPDLSCLRWLMNCGTTRVKMSDGTEITSQRQMREFIQSVGEFDTQKRIVAPNTQLVKMYESAAMMNASVRNDAVFLQRWPNVAPVFIEEVDATDAAICDRGFSYFKECRQLKRLKMNFCDYFSDLAIRELATGRPGRTLVDLEIAMNGRLTDGVTHWITKMRQLRRVHLYFLPYVVNREAVLRELRVSLPRCRVTFPDTVYIGYGYEDDGGDTYDAQAETERAKKEEKDTG